MARKSKDPRKPSQAYLAATGQLKPATDVEPATPSKTVDVPVAATTPSKATPLKSTPVKKPAASKKPSEEDDVLRREIKALGGDDEDWELLKDLSDSEEEVEAETPKKAGKTKSSTISAATEVSSSSPSVWDWRSERLPSGMIYRFTENAQERAFGVHEEPRLCRRCPCGSHR